MPTLRGSITLLGDYNFYFAFLSVNRRKYCGIIKVLYHDKRVVTEPDSSREIALIGYYQNVTVFSASEADAITQLRGVVTDGHIDWSDSTLRETTQGFLDWFRVLTGKRVIFNGGKAAFPGEGQDGNAKEGEPIAWKLRNAGSPERRCQS